MFLVYIVSPTCALYDKRNERTVAKVDVIQKYATKFWYIYRFITIKI